MTFARRVDQIQPSQTLGISALVESLRREGKSVIGLGAGEPDFDTPQIVKEAAICAIEEGFTKYTPVSGTLELKEAICEKYQKQHEYEVSPAEVLVACGAKHALANVLLALCQPGDEVIIPAPYWTSYIELTRFVGARPVVLETDETTEFKMTPAQLASAITPQTKVLLLNTPCNPTGSVYHRSELSDLADVCKQHPFHVIFDEIYEKIVYDGSEHVSLAGFPELRERLILINGVSKTFAMTGWRLGYVIAPQALIKACSKIQSHTTSNPCSISQKAGIAALRAESRIVEQMVQEFDRRRVFLTNQMNEMPGIRCLLPKGAFYTFANVSEYLDIEVEDRRIASPMGLCAYLLEEEGVAVVPGEAFGSSQHVRISYATSMGNLEEAVLRLNRAFARLRG